jgi:hypothetical protein
MYMKPDLDFDKTIAERLGYSDFVVSGLSGFLYGYKDGVQDPIPQFCHDMNAAWSLFDGDNIKLELGKYPDGRVSASFWDKVWFTQVGDNPAHASALAWYDRELWRNAQLGRVV